ncbi:aromatic ring-hydroxylating dioxygenase subunit alpha [Paraburkholderia kururiensis]|uniref:aromatic ring-hydroxylating dioxygenase subunit alpha n=1 Tax=Paraburkholderia kururiensis TaxID=984307 RepID=UPI0018F3186C|nr:aromatic ring-hydroxylating dioxygenase subunit alpha [Paraburkholderia kururiensis]
MFLKNCWYVACMSGDLDDRPLERRVCGEPIIFLRKRDRAVTAFECPHQHSQLCPESGRHSALATNGQMGDDYSTLHRYPVVDRHGFVWVWPGDPDGANISDIPAFTWPNNPEWTYVGGLNHVQCDYRLMVDKLMDPTREAFGCPENTRPRATEHAPYKTSVKGNRIITSRHVANTVATPFWSQALRAGGLEANTRCDRWQICHFMPPGHVLIEAGAASAGTGGYNAAPQHKACALGVVLLTPETETSTWQFWGIARGIRPDDTALTTATRQAHGKAFCRDLGMPEVQRRDPFPPSSGSLPDFRIGAGGLQARRIMGQLIAHEQRGMPMTS